MFLLSAFVAVPFEMSSVTKWKIRRNQNWR